MKVHEIHDKIVDNNSGKKGFTHPLTAPLILKILNHYLIHEY